jgi:hypothetical protein
LSWHPADLSVNVTLPLPDGNLFNLDDRSDWIENDMLSRCPPAFPVPVAHERTAAGLVAAVMLAGCGGDGDGGRPAINWNLSTDHTTADVDWPEPGQSAVQIEEPASVRIRFPGGKSFSGQRGRPRA